MRPSPWTVVLALGAGAACVGDADPPMLRLTAFAQAGADPVFLDEPLDFFFSEDVDPSSVTSESVRIHPAGEPERRARGRFRVHRGRVEFVPDLPTQPDLSDGGLLPDTRYVVELVGYPRPDGLRGSSPLEASFRSTFRTASPDGPVFGNDPATGRLTLSLDLRGPGGELSLGPLDPIVLNASQGIDPTSLEVGEFRILPEDGDPNRDVLPLRPRLVTNERRGARLELFATAGDDGLRALPEGTYYLSRVGDAMRTLGGLPMTFGLGPVPLRLLVRAGLRREVFRFDGSERPWHRAPSGFDGTAHIVPDGSGVTIRYPAAAGDGRDGLQDPFEGLAGRSDVAATRLVVAAESEVALDGVPGPVVLRSQGALLVEGRLSRTLEGDGSSRLVEELARRALGDPAGWPTIGAWLRQLLGTEEPWTVLVAGGDLVVTGSIEVDGPLLLLAGGWIRVEGSITSGGAFFRSSPGSGSLGQARTAPLLFDPPRTNRLARPLRVAVLSSAFRPIGGLKAWGEARPLSDAGRGTVDVRYVGLRDVEGQDAGGAEPETFTSLPRLEQLDGCQAVRLEVMLGMPVGQGEPWEPPRVEGVELTWQAP